MKDELRLGLKENWKQFVLLVIVNFFVGGMVGMERTVFPQFALQEFGISSTSAILSFIVAFGLSKALANYFSGLLTKKIGSKNLLLIGWLIAIPIPFILINAPSWNWVIFANLLLGISQGLTWSSTVVMKIDLVGEQNRGLAMGLNEFAGYISVGVMAFFSGYIANRYGITPYPFYIGIVLSVTGLILTIFWVTDTRKFVHQENRTSNVALLDQVFLETTIKNKTLSSVTQAGLVNNLNDGMIWGLLPILLISFNYNQENIGLVTAIYPTIWGIGQAFTGSLSDRYSKKALLFWGMFLQGLAILLLPLSDEFIILALLSAILGLGTALVYPTFLSTIAQATKPDQRAESIGVFRLWRDLGYAIGAVISGFIADIFGLEYAMGSIGVLTLASSLIIKFRMPHDIQSSRECIGVEDVKQAMMERKKIQIIDVRADEEIEISPIPNAIHLSIGDLGGKLTQLDPRFQFVVAGKEGGRDSVDAVKILRGFGLNASWLCGGTEKWLGFLKRTKTT